MTAIEDKETDVEGEQAHMMFITFGRHQGTPKPHHQNDGREESWNNHIAHKWSRWSQEWCTWKNRESRVSTCANSDIRKRDP